jgi:uncharacterized protein
MAKPKPQRIRDPIHNLIEFDSGEFENCLWQVIQTEPFQRLRRIRQLGFSEFVFPGATHTRFAHSIGVFHTARQLMNVICRHIQINSSSQYKPQQAQHALAAALLHDVGHGMFSHAFEAVGKEFKWAMAKHEDVSQKLIRDSEISEVLNRELGKGYAENVADIIAQEIPATLYGAVVSSQFDADRLDYMQRDRLMTGVQSSVVDSTWLLANLEVAEVRTGVDDVVSGTVETLVLGPKAVHAAESYVLSLFHLYPNVYFHKTTRGAEKIFQALMRRLVYLHEKAVPLKGGLSEQHPIFKFIAEPSSLQKALALDDTVFWGSLSMLAEAEDSDVKRLAEALRKRQLLKCVDIKQRVEEAIAAFEGQVETFTAAEKRKERQARVKIMCDSIVNALTERDSSSGCGQVRFLIDQYVRNPYKRFQDSKSQLNQILVRAGNAPPTDMAEYSPIIASAEPFSLCRVYFFRDDKDAEGVIQNEIRTKIKETNYVKG